jgi:hypothetical protein
MTVEARIDTLESKHLRLTENIHKAYTHHTADDKLIKLKKKRLRLEDEIESLRNSED